MSGTVFAVLLARRDLAAAWCVLGSIIASFINKVRQYRAAWLLPCNYVTLVRQWWQVRQALQGCLHAWCTQLHDQGAGVRIRYPRVLHALRDAA